MQVTITIDDALAARVTPHLGPLPAYVQTRVQSWLEQIVPALEEQDRQRLLQAYLDAPAGVQEQVEALLEPYEPPPPQDPPEMVPQ